jgi:hypothetical protein
MKSDMTASLPANTETEAQVRVSPRRRRLLRILWRLFQLCLLLAPFLILDWVHSATLRRSTRSSARMKNCGVRDPVLHHAFQPNCTAEYPWGGSWYQFSTNSLGFRDETVREVPLADARPRILILGDSMTEGMLPWSDSYVGRIAAHFPQYDFLNGAARSYSPSNYFNVARLVLACGYDIDEVIAFIDISDVQDEATFYRDKDSSGAVSGPQPEHYPVSWWAKTRMFIAGRLFLTNHLLESCERFLVDRGFYHLNTGPLGDAFDMERGAWTYRKVNETAPYYDGYAPLGVEGGIAREQEKMTRLWHLLAEKNIPLSVVVYPHPPQVLHDTVNSRQVGMWRQWCEGKCKRFVSLFPVFLAVKEQCPSSHPGCWYLSHFVFGDIHYNATGNALAASVVIKSLEETPPVEHPQTSAPVSAASIAP